MNTVAVYIPTLHTHLSRAAKVEPLFRNPLFSPHILDIQPPDNLTSSSSIENYLLHVCLRHAREEHPNDHLIIANDTSSTDASPERVADIVSASLQGKPWDLCYLGKWQDRCDLHTHKRPINGTMTSLAKTQGPNGFQALLISPETRDTLLGLKPMKSGRHFSPHNRTFGSALKEAISSGDLEASCADSSLFRYDPSFASSPEDYSRLQECIVPTHGSLNTSTHSTGMLSNMNGKNLQQTTSSSNWLWWILLILIILVIIAVIVYLLRKHNALRF